MHGGNQGGGGGFLGTSGHRQMTNPSVMNLQHRLVLELSVGLSFDQRQAQWRIDLFWRQLQAISARSYRSLARDLHSSGYTQPTCSQGGRPCEGFEKRWRTTTTSVGGVCWKIYGFNSVIGNREGLLGHKRPACMSLFVFFHPVAPRIIVFSWRTCLYF